jgi:predicted RNA-binding Zn-ribbon protein involved in translation (DUF1610 family)
MSERQFIVRQCHGCGDELRIETPAVSDGSTFISDLSRSQRCPRCGQVVLVGAELQRGRRRRELPRQLIGLEEQREGTPDASPLRTTLLAMRGLLHMALQHLDRVLREEHV